MAMFQYEAMNSAGQVVKDELEAPSSEEAITKIRNLGYFPTKVREKGGRKRKPAASKAAPTARGKSGGGLGSITIGGVSAKQLTAFTRQLSTLQDAGLPILRSLKILEQQLKPGVLRNVLDGVSDDVENGSTLSEAMAKHPKAFDRLYCNMVAAGEAGGVLDIILSRLAEFMEKAQKLKRRVIGAMIYPACVISFASLIVMGIMIFVVPKFEEIFVDFDAELPMITQKLMGLSNWIAAGGWLAIFMVPLALVLTVRYLRRARNFTNSIISFCGVVGVVAAVAFAMLLALGMVAPGEDGSIMPQERMQLWFSVVLTAMTIPLIIFALALLLGSGRGGTGFGIDMILLNIPIMGKILEKTAVARFTRTLGTLIAAGVPILEAINITKDTAGNGVFVRALSRVHDSIREGESFAGPLKATRICDPIVVNMIDVGEETGDLDKMLMKIADNYDEEVDTLVSSLVSLLEPIMVVALGLIVGTIVVALFLPLVTLIQSVSGG